MDPQRGRSHIRGITGLRHKFGGTDHLKMGNGDVQTHRTSDDSVVSLSNTKTGYE